MFFYNLKYNMGDNLDGLSYLKIIKKILKKKDTKTSKV
ncbi:hypothetical protein RU86_GL000229 [Lactococcus piscium]|uniref:Uncharacterized protein n=1 Tax=Pseudolactococcus piscium TaxID=1364 RepID=A0A2A5RZF5_9LACT|nr:hypothetical protein RU86_GL000229 [Lactococcus piscium]